MVAVDVLSGGMQLKSVNTCHNIVTARWLFSFCQQSAFRQNSISFVLVQLLPGAVLFSFVIWIEEYENCIKIGRTMWFVLFLCYSEVINMQQNKKGEGSRLGNNFWDGLALSTHPPVQLVLHPIFFWVLKSDHLWSSGDVTVQGRNCTVEKWGRGSRGAQRAKRDTHAMAPLVLVRPLGVRGALAAAHALLQVTGAQVLGGGHFEGRGLLWLHKATLSDSGRTATHHRQLTKRPATTNEGPITKIATLLVLFLVWSNFKSKYGCYHGELLFTFPAKCCPEYLVVSYSAGGFFEKSSFWLLKRMWNGVY